MHSVRSESNQVTRTKTKTPAHTAWKRRPQELADWTQERLVSRTDRYGRHRTKGEVDYLTEKLGRPASNRTTEENLTREVLVRHFRGERASHIIGTFPADADSRSKSGALDIDRHDAEDPAANWGFTNAAYETLVRQGFHPLLTDSDGKGGYHLRVLLRGKVGADRLHHFLKGLAASYREYGLADPPEVFPKQPDVRKCGKGLGNWLRLTGKHHTRDHWSRVWDGARWLEGNAAIDHILTLTGDPRRLIPKLPPSPLPPAQPGQRGANPTQTEGEEEAKRHERAVRAIQATFTGSIESLTSGERRQINALAQRFRPKRTRQRNGLIFKYAQAVKGMRDDWTSPQLSAIFQIWWALAKDVVVTKHEDFNFSEFRRAYKNCHSPGGFSWERIVAQSEEEELPEVARYYPQGTQRLARACARAQRVVGARAFSVSCEQATGVMGCSSSRTGWKALDLLCDDGILELVEKGFRVKGENVEGKIVKGTSVASRYLYLPMWSEEGEFRPGDN
jgi:hypothetical protein